MKEVSIFSWRASSCWSLKDDSSNENMRSAAAVRGLYKQCRGGSRRPTMGSCRKS